MKFKIAVLVLIVALGAFFVGTTVNSHPAIQVTAENRLPTRSLQNAKKNTQPLKNLSITNLWPLWKIQSRLPKHIVRNSYRRNPSRCRGRNRTRIRGAATYRGVRSHLARPVLRPSRSLPRPADCPRSQPVPGKSPAWLPTQGHHRASQKVRRDSQRDTRHQRRRCVSTWRQRPSSRCRCNLQASFATASTRFFPRPPHGPPHQPFGTHFASTNSQ